MSYIITLGDNILTMTDEELELMLYKHLKQNRYLVVLDNIWSTAAWDDLQCSFPNDKNGSRILISRYHDVVLKVRPDINPHKLALSSLMMKVGSY